MTTEEPQILYADIKDRLFASILDLSLLYYFVVPLTSIILMGTYGDDSPLNDARQLVVQQNPKLAGNEQAIMIEIYNNHQEALVAGIKISIYEGFLQLMLMTIYFVPLISKKGATLGKMLVGLKVVDSITHQKLSTAQSLIRYFGYVPSVLPVFMGFIWGGFRKDKRCWHDFMADSIVIYDENRWYKRLWQKFMGYLTNK